MLVKLIVLLVRLLIWVSLTLSSAHVCLPSFFKGAKIQPTKVRKICELKSIIVRLLQKKTNISVETGAFVTDRSGIRLKIED